MKKLCRREVPVRDCHGRKRPRNDKEGNFLCHCHETLCRAGTCPRRVQELPSMYRLGHAYCLPLRGRLGDACERRLWRRKRARRSGRIKATDKGALPTQTEPLIQQDMSQPYRGAYLEKMIFSLRNIRVSTRAPSRAYIRLLPTVSSRCRAEMSKVRMLTMLCTELYSGMQ